MKVKFFLSKTKDNRNILPSARILYTALLSPLTPLVITLIVGGSSAFALDPMGPPIAGPIQGQFRNGVEYSHGTMDFELKEGKVIEFLDGVFFDSGKADSFTLKNFKAHKSYFNLGYGATDNVEAFLRLGATVGRFGDSIWQDDEKFDGEAEIAVGGGIKATFYEEDNLKLGGLFQVSRAEFDGQLNASHWPAADSVEIRITETQIAVGAAYMAMERVLFYGGPFFHFISGELDDEVSQISGGSLLRSEYSWDVEESSVFGGFLGAQLELNENSSLNIEFQHTANADAISIGLVWRL